MPNITDEYNFSELCQAAKASAPWVKKVQRLLKLGEGGGGKGARTYYSAEQVHIYAAVKKLRLVDLEFDEIESLYELEKKLRAFPSAKPVLKSEAKEKDLKITLALIILLESDQVLFIDYASLTREKKEELEKLFQKYDRALDYVQRCAKDTEETAQQLSTSVGEFKMSNITSVLPAFRSDGLSK